MKLSPSIAPLSTWLCGGALLASLAWNAREAFRPTDCAAPCSPATEATAGAALECSIDFLALGVSEEQARALETLCTLECRSADELALRADEKQAELEQLLAGPDLDPASVRALAREVGELRARSVETCVEAALRVRAVLTPSQTAELLESCRERCQK